MNALRACFTAMRHANPQRLSVSRTGLHVPLQFKLPKTKTKTTAILDVFANHMRVCQFHVGGTQMFLAQDISCREKVIARIEDVFFKNVVVENDGMALEEAAGALSNMRGHLLFCFSVQVWTREETRFRARRKVWFCLIARTESFRFQKEGGDGEPFLKQSATDFSNTAMKVPKCMQASVLSDCPHRSNNRQIGGIDKGNIFLFPETVPLVPLVGV